MTRDELFQLEWAHFPNDLQKALFDYARYTTIENRAYITGYITALNNNNIISKGSAEYALSLTSEVNQVIACDFILYEKGNK